MDEFLRDAFNCEPLASEGANHQYEISGDGHGRVLELVEVDEGVEFGGVEDVEYSEVHHHSSVVLETGSLLTIGSAKKIVYLRFTITMPDTWDLESIALTGRTLSAVFG